MLLIFGAAMGVAVWQEAAVERLRAVTPDIKRWGGWVLLAVGAWLIAPSVWSDLFARLFPG